jgi:hypothetical protein
MTTFMAEEEKQLARTSAEVSMDALHPKDGEPCAQQLIGGNYEHNCPYLGSAKKFRFVEKFPE